MAKIMIVDDEVLERNALKVILKNLENIEIVAEACNGREAIELDKKYNPDLIIMDIKMPGIDGCKATEIIKSNNKDKIIIMLSAYDDFDLVRKALTLGVDEYILKPFNPQKLKNIINNNIVNLKINNNKISAKYLCRLDRYQQAAFKCVCITGFVILNWNLFFPVRGRGKASFGAAAHGKYLEYVLAHGADSGSGYRRQGFLYQWPFLACCQVFCNAWKTLGL